MSVVAEPLASSKHDEKHFEGARLVQPRLEPEHSVETDYAVTEAPAAIPPPPGDPVDDLPMHQVIRLLRSPVPGHIANSSARSSAARRVQRTLGNRASQQIVMRARVVQRQCACGGTCAKCQEEERQRQIQRVVQRSSAAPVSGEFDGIPASTGEQLDPATRHPMEAHFGADLADVRVHTGSEAAKSATSIDALAYTTGRDIYFASGMYAPSSDSGRRLLAHEVAHVVQQSSGKEPTVASKSSHGAKIGAPDDPLETEADRASEAFMTAPLTDEDERKKREAGSTVQRFIQRQCEPGSTQRTTTPALQRQTDAGAPPPAPQDAGPTLVPAVVPPAPAIDGGTLAPAPDQAPGGLDAGQYKRLVTARAILSKVPKIDDASRADLAKALPAAAVKQQMAIRDAKAARLTEAAEELTSLRPSAGVPDEATAAKMNVLEHEIDGLNQEIPALNASILGSLNELKIPGETQADKEQNLVTFVTETFPARFESRAEQIVISELDENAKIAQAEKARYRDICTEEGDDAGQKNRDGLRAAAKDLALRMSIIDGLKHDLYEAEARVPAAGVSPEGELAGNLRDAVGLRNRELDDTRKQYGLKFPILLRDGVDIQALASSNDKDLNKIVGEQVDKVLEDIEDTKGNLLSKKLRIWDLTDPKTGYDVIGITEQDLSIEEPLLLDVIKQWVQNEKSDEAAWNLFFAALAITATILVSLTPLGPLGGAIVGGAIGAAQLASDVSKYYALDAANDVALDPEIAKIAKDEPSIFWIVVDVVFVVLDVSAAKNAIRAMRAPAQALLEGGSVAEFAVQAKELAPEAADRLIASAEKKVATRELPGGLKSIAEAADEEPGVLAHAFTDEGHEIKVSADGITRCSPGVACPLVKDTFAKQVAEDHQAAEDLSRAESLAKTAPKAAAAAAKAAERRLVTQAFIDAMEPKVIEQLKNLGIDGEDLHRVLANGSELGNVKGRLYDEIFASHARKLMETGAGRQALAGGKELSPELAAKLEFIPGSSITDIWGNDLTDGILGWREGNKLHVVNIFEAKASRNAAAELRVIEERASRLPKKEIEDIRKYAEELFQEFSEEAAKANKPLGLTVEDILEDLHGYANTKQWGGQIRETVERLDISVAKDHDLDLLTKIKVDGKEMEVADISASSKITGVVPSDVNLKRLQKDMVKPLDKGGMGLKGFDVLKTPQKQQEVLDLAQQISNGAKNAAGAVD